ncbi:DUF5686 family protein [Porphyromonas circumdentaria]|uniref:CarboxypepD_reg-like domain-containing protein n=1 Tax=Porphyromonas circumdentaria TaxID=29524 RepID=A0A1T4PN72_9PORP|nr:DUF5686 family protein [Porphyromonas circumdentaria]MBB6276468.1 hypothetical protein [Porphyromonas circumdentaria]SJZ92716.1 hypothetical protein SAMN02745171_01513 [Porphyromonas circumdentaria]
MKHLNKSILLYGDLSPLRRAFASVLFLLLLSMPALSQIMVRGRAIDSISGEPLVGASIFLTKHRDIGAVADLDGNFKLTIPAYYAKNLRQTLSASMVGYRTGTIRLEQTKVKNGYYWQFNLRGAELQTVVVSPKKKRYRKKGNPAVAIMERAIANKEKNRVESQKNFSYQVYRRQIIGLTDSLHKPFSSLFGIDKKRWESWSDSSGFAGLKVRPFSIRERHSVRANIGGVEQDELIIGRRYQGIEEAIEGPQIMLNLEELMPEINLYNNDLGLFLNSFPGPMSSLFSTSFYKYYLLDTVMLNDRPSFQIGVVPFSIHSIGFKGTLWIDTASYALAKAHLELPKEANVDWVQGCYLTAEYAPHVLGSDTLWLPKRQDLHTLLSPTPLIKQNAEFYQSFVYTHYKRGEEALDSLALDPRKALSSEVRKEIDKPRRTSFGIVTRPEPLPPLGEGTLAMMEYVHKDPIYLTLAKGAQLLSRGFLGLPLNRLKREDYYAELGPLESVIAWNTLEGVRLRLGGVTSARLSPHFFGQGYVGYGLGDERWKYYARLIYTPVEKDTHENEYPRKNIALTVQNDLFVPGYEEEALYKDGLGTLLGTMNIRERYYEQSASLSFLADLSKTWGISLWGNVYRRTSAGDLHYYRINHEGDRIEVPSLQRTTIGASVTFTPGKEPIDNRRPKQAMNFKRFHPTISLRATYLPDGVLGNNGHKGAVALSFYNRFYLSLFGYVDASVLGGLSLGKVDEADFYTPGINASWVLSRKNFQLMRPLEFVADKYLEFNFFYRMRGLVLNRIPLINRLGLREVFSLHGYWGDVSRERTKHREGEFVYPITVSPMHNHLYLEGSAGVEGIFNIFAVHYFHRFTPSILSDTPMWGIRIGMGMSF